MILARVLSRIVSTARLESLPKERYLWVEPIEGFGKKSDRWIAIDSVDAGPGDVVLVLQEGTGARQVLNYSSDDPLPAQMVIVGVVDDVQRAEKT